jgi:hypothetical protein
MPPAVQGPILDDDGGVKGDVEGELPMKDNCDTAADNEKALPASKDTVAVSDELPLKRKRKARQVDNFFVHDETAKKKAPVRKKKVMDAEEEFESYWICSECKEAECMMKPEADKLLICEGACRRLFHYPCAGLAELPGEDEEYICADCTTRKHSCSLCHHYGLDNEDVFCCSKDGCGLFFHESCLSMQNIEVQRTHTQQEDLASVDVDETASDSLEKSTNGSSGGTCRFICPAHNCWTCTQDKQPTDKASPNKKGRKKKVNKGGAYDVKTQSRIIVSSRVVHGVR